MDIKCIPIKCDAYVEASLPIINGDYPHKLPSRRVVIRRYCNILSRLNNMNMLCDYTSFAKFILIADYRNLHDEGYYDFRNNATIYADCSWIPLLMLGQHGPGEIAKIRIPGHIKYDSGEEEFVILELTMTLHNYEDYKVNNEIDNKIFGLLSNRIEGGYFASNIEDVTDPKQYALYFVPAYDGYAVYIYYNEWIHFRDIKTPTVDHPTSLKDMLRNQFANQCIKYSKEYFLLTNKRPFHLRPSLNWYK